MPVTIEAWAGGSVDRGSFAPPLLLRYGGPRVLSLDPSASGQVRLPDATRCRPGRCLWWLVNESATRTLEVVDFDLNSLGTLETDTGGGNTPHAWVSLVDNSTAAGVWQVLLLEKAF